MRPYDEPKQPHPLGVAETTEEKLRNEVEELKRQIREQKGLSGDHTRSGVSTKVWHPSGVTIGAIVLMLAVLIIAAFFAGYIPLQKRTALIQTEANEQQAAVLRVEVIEVGRSSGLNELELPGNIQAVTEAPILARADGYIRRRMVDIGDRIKAGQPMAEIEAPELDQQIRQAKASVDQAQATLDQAVANYEQGKSNLELARVTAQRWSGLAAQGIVSRQENDQYQAQYQAQLSSVQALEKVIAAQRGNHAVTEANVARLNEVQSYRVVKAPFDGVVTQRNVDVGALVMTGNTLLFRIAQTDTLRAYVNVPQASASFIRPGQLARLSIANMPGRRFSGTVARTANALDPSSRTMLVEIQVPNSDGTLLPGMYAQVDLASIRTGQPLLIPGDALIARAEGTQVAVVGTDHHVHLQKIQVGRDYGDRLEVMAGLKEGDLIIPNPGEAAHEGIQVDPISAAEKESTPVVAKPSR